jgi:hypothetical protein
MHRIVFLLFASGCQVLFPLDGSKSPPSEDELRCDAMNDAVGLPLVADTYFEGDQPHGAESSLLFGMQHVLLRFESGALNLEDLEFTLQINIAARADECGGPCAVCAPSAGGSAPQLVLTNPDWDEATTAAPPTGADVTGFLNGNGSGDLDSISSVFQLPPGSVSPGWPAIGEMSILVVPASTNPFVQRLGSRENTCGVPQASLVGRCLRVAP